MTKRVLESGPSVVRWIDVGEYVLRHYKDLRDREQTKRIVPELWECFDVSRREASNGDRRISELRAALQYLDDYPDKWVRSPQQKQFHEAFHAACIKNVYKEEFAANYLRILEENDWDEARQEVLICCPRRFGKTIAVCMYVAAYAYTQPNCKICIFSPSRRQSEMLLDQVKEFLFKFRDFKIKRLNKENLWLQGPDDNDIRKIMAYPSNVEIDTNGENGLHAAHYPTHQQTTPPHPTHTHPTMRSLTPCTCLTQCQTPCQAQRSTWPVRRHGGGCRERRRPRYERLS